MISRRSVISLGAAAALAGTAWAVEARADRREAQAERDFPPEGRVLSVGGRRVHAVTLGRGADVVLIHGAGGNARDFTFDLVGRLSARFRVTAFDRPGLGHTPALSDAVWSGHGETPAEQAALLQAAAMQLGIDRPVVVGHSYGAAVAMAWVLNHPAAALVSLAGAVLPWPGPLDPFYRVLGSAPGGAALVPFLTAFASDAQVRRAIDQVFAPQPAPAGYLDHFGAALTLRRASLRASTRQVNTLLPQVRAMAPRYPGLTLPIEIVHGDADRTVGLDIHSRPLAATVASARLTVLPGVGHMPHHADPAAAVAAITCAAERAGLR
jgi:pimeloyl-ACP methyl ester carboxylesterase